MKIGIDCRTMSDSAGMEAGIGHYTRFLVEALTANYNNHEFVLFVDHYATDNAALQALEDLAHVTLVRFPFSEHKRYLPLVHSHWMVARMLKRHQLDVFHAPANIIPLGYDGLSVVTVHDLAVFEHPEWFPDSQRLARKVLIPKTMEKAARVIAVSQATRDQIGRVLHVPQEKVQVIPLGVDHMLPPQSSGRTRPFILFVGTLEPRKNVARLLQAYDLLLERHPHLQSFDFVLAGKRGWKHDDIDEVLEDMRHAQSVYELGYVSAQEKAALMNDAQLFVFPSLDEGFGLPALEAASLGTAIVVSERGALPEVVGPDIPLVDPEDVDAISNGMAMLLNDDQLRESVAQLGHVKSESYTWKRVAEQTMDIYTQVFN